MAERLALAMKEAGKDGVPVSNSDLARGSGVSPSAVGQWLSGAVVNLRPENLHNAAKYLGVSTDWLAAGVGPMSRKAAANQPTVSARALRLAELFDLMEQSPEHLAKAEAVLEAVWVDFKESRTRREQRVEAGETQE